MPNQYPDEPFGRAPRGTSPQAGPGAGGIGPGPQVLTGPAANQNQKQFDGQTVTVLRAAQEGDEGFKKKGGEQALVQMPDGSQRVVAAADLKDAAPPAPPAPAGNPG